MAAPDSGYDPYAFRNVENALTNTETFINLIKSFIGTGVLAMPIAFRNAGWLVGLISTALLTMILIYTMHLVIWGIYKACKIDQVPTMTYSEAMAVAFREGPHATRRLQRCAHCLTDFFLGLYHFGICSVYVLFMSETLKQVIDSSTGSNTMDVRLYALALLVPLILIYSIRDLKHLTPASFVANILIIIGLCAILYYVFSALPAFSNMSPTAEIQKYPIYFGDVLFALESVGVVIALESKMATPQRYLGWLGILTIGMSLVGFLYAFVGFFGYWRYGLSIQGSITLNLPLHDIVPQVVKMIYAIAIYFSYPLQGYVTMDIIANSYVIPKVREGRKLLVEYILRSCFCLCTVIVAMGIPNLGLCLSLFGSFCLSVLGIIFPGAMDLIFRYHEGYGRCKILLWKNIAIIIFGFIGMIAGSGVAIMDIIELYNPPPPAAAPAPAGGD